MFTVTQNNAPLEVNGRKIRGRDLQAVTLRAFQHATKVCRAVSETNPVIHAAYTGEDARKNREEDEKLAAEVARAAGKVGEPNCDLGYPRWEITAAVPAYVIVDDKTGEEAARITPRFFYIEAKHVVKVEHVSMRGRKWRTEEVQEYTGTRFSLTTEVKTAKA